MKSSSERIGQLYSTLVDYREKNIIDEGHRYGVDKNWRRVRREHIKTKKDRLIARISNNICRRSVPSREKRDLLAELGEIHSEGTESRRIPARIIMEW